MKKLFLSRRDRGFSLIEILVAVLLISILLAVAVPRLLSSRERAGDSAAKQQIETVVTEVRSIATDSDSYAGATAAVLTGYLPDMSIVSGATAGGKVANANARIVSVDDAPTASQWTAAVYGSDNSDGTAKCWAIRLNKTSGTQYMKFTQATPAGCIENNVPATGWQTGGWPTS